MCHKTATLCTEELFLRTRYMVIFTYQTGKNLGERIPTVNTTHLVVLLGFHTSQLVLRAIHKVLISKVFIQLFCDQEDKYCQADFLFPAIQYKLSKKVGSSFFLICWKFYRKIFTQFFKFHTQNFATSPVYGMIMLQRAVRIR